MRLGLVGGLGPLATAHYYRVLAENHADAAAGMVIIQADLNRVLSLASKGDMEGLAEYLSVEIGHLKGAGAQVAAIAAVTPHICLPQLVGRAVLPVIDMIEVISRHLANSPYRRIALFGTHPVMESGLFGRLRDVTIITPRPEERQFIHETYLDIVHRRGNQIEQRALLRNLASGLAKRDGVEGFILAGTELSVLFGKEDIGFNAIDCARLHIAAIVSRLASER